MKETGKMGTEETSVGRNTDAQIERQEQDGAHVKLACEFRGDVTPIYRKLIPLKRIQDTEDIR
jgi:hypothetical protein